MFTNRRDNSLVTPRIRKARWANFAGFMIIGALFYTWSVGVSAFRNRLGMQGALGDLDFGMVALGIAIGATVGAFVVGQLVDLFGPRAVIRCTLLAYPLSLIGLGLADQYWFAMTFGIVLGTLRGATDTALNAHGVQIERFYQRPIMSSFHACFSLGGFVFGIIASYLAGLSEESAIIPFTVAGLSLAALSLVMSHFLLAKDELLTADDSEQKPEPLAPVDIRVTALMVGLGTLMIAGMISESAVSDWGQEFLMRESGLSIATAGLGISLFTGAGFVGRITGDWLAERIGRAGMMFFCGVTSIVGIGLSTLSHDGYVAMAGFALLGLGLACVAPLLVSAAGSKDPVNAGRNVGIVNGVGFAGLLGGPAAYSYVVTVFGIGALFYVPLVLACLLTVFGPILMNTRRKEQLVHALPMIR